MRILAICPAVEGADQPPDIGIEQLETVLDEIQHVDERLDEYQDYMARSAEELDGVLALASPEPPKRESPVM